jgi:hypothetical protein
MSDLRVTIGGFFVLAGGIVTATGLAANYHAPLETANVNLYGGGAMLICGAIMLWLAWHKSR